MYIQPDSDNALTVGRTSDTLRYLEYQGNLNIE